MKEEITKEHKKEFNELIKKLDELMGRIESYLPGAYFYLGPDNVACLKNNKKACIRLIDKDSSVIKGALSKFRSRIIDPNQNHDPNRDRTLVSQILVFGSRSQFLEE